MAIFQQTRHLLSTLHQHQTCHLLLTSLVALSTLTVHISHLHSILQVQKVVHIQDLILLQQSTEKDSNSVQTLLEQENIHMYMIQDKNTQQTHHISTNQMKIRLLQLEKPQLFQQDNSISTQSSFHMLLWNLMRKLF